MLIVPWQEPSGVQDHLTDGDHNHADWEHCCTDEKPFYVGQGGCDTHSNCVGSIKYKADWQQYNSRGAEWFKCYGP